jgi:hypothetical protein
MRNYLSFGGGVNSVALHLLMLEQGVDFESVFVHHGTDWPETYDYVAGFQWWLKANGHRPITVLRPSRKYSRIIDECEAYNIVPHMRFRWCTDKFKVSVVNKYVEKPCFMNIGIDAGESKRAKLNSSNGIENRFPLLERDIDRAGCINIIKAYGLPIPMKSGCYICPFQKVSQWKDLRIKHPCLFQRVAALEEANMRRSKELGRRVYTLRSNKQTLPSVIDENQGVLFERDEYPPCLCGL